MRIEDCKVGQRVFVKRESTAKVDGFDGVLINLMKTLSIVSGADVVDICKKEKGFYIVSVKDNNLILGKKDEKGLLQPGWGIFAPEDVDLADEEKKEEPKSKSFELLETILKQLKTNNELLSKFLESQGLSTKKQSRGRPKKK